MFVSIFNDVIGPVMRGPSSSHCAAALRIGRIAFDLMSGKIDKVLLEFDTLGSLPTTHDSQGSDMGLFGGLMGWEATDSRLPSSMQTMRSLGTEIEIKYLELHDPHPNTYRLTVSNSEESHYIRAISTGGGMMEVLEIDGFLLSLHGDCSETLIFLDGDVADPMNLIQNEFNADAVHAIKLGGRALIQVKASSFLPATLKQVLASSGSVIKEIHPVLPILTTKDSKIPFHSSASMLEYDAGRGTPLWELAALYESERGCLSTAEVESKMVELVRILKNSIAEGLAGTEYEDRVLGFQSGGFKKLMESGELLNGGAVNRMILYVTALMEVKSSMGVIIAMPTAGACAALPGGVIAMAEEMGLGEVEIARAFLASGIIGVFITTAWTFAAEVGGCQAEGGAASAMAAAALVTLAGGTQAQALAAASMALQSVLGLMCDPIANRVEAPCLGKNVMAASNALCAANMALAGYDPLIPFDEVVETAKRVAQMMPRELRCTGLGGLSMTPTAKKIEKMLMLKQRR